MQLKRVIPTLIRYLCSLRPDVLLPMHLQALMDDTYEHVMIEDGQLKSTAIEHVYSTLESISIDIWNETVELVKEDVDELLRFKQHYEILVQKPLPFTDEDKCHRDDLEQMIYYRRKKQNYNVQQKQRTWQLNHTKCRMKQLRSRILREENKARSYIEKKRTSCKDHLNQYYSTISRYDKTVYHVDMKRLDRCAAAGYHGCYFSYAEVLKDTEFLLVAID